MPRFLAGDGRRDMQTGRRENGPENTPGRSSCGIGPEPAEWDAP